MDIDATYAGAVEGTDPGEWFTLDAKKEKKSVPNVAPEAPEHQVTQAEKDAAKSAGDANGVALPPPPPIDPALKDIEPTALPPKKKKTNEA